MDLVRRPGGELEPHRRPAGYRVLLPAEIELCETLGLTVDDYFYFLSLTESYTAERAKEYELVPDVRNDPVSIVISLAIGIALQAISYLLSPKPRAQDQRTPPSFRTADRIGQSKFAPLSNFDSVQELATLGSIIPLVFTNKGVRVNAQLLWSQLISYGSSQEMRAIMLLSHGQLGAAPDYRGYAIGSSNLNNYTTGKVALYFKPNGGRIADSAPDRYAESGLTVVGHTSDVFQVFWDKDNRVRPYFSGTRTPDSQTQFGIYTPIHNGQLYRIPFETTVIPASAPRGSTSVIESLNKRRKIETAFPRWIAVGEVRNSAGQVVTSNLGTVGNVVTVILADRANADNGDTFGNVGDSDIRSVITDGKIAADETFNIGEQYMIGTALAICTGSSTTNPYIENTQKLWYFTITESGFVQQAETRGVAQPSARMGVYRAAVGVITNARECDVTEIGIKSTVFKQITGFPNVNSFPGNNVMLQFEKENGNYVLGNISGYVKRFSFFQLFYRKVGTTNWIDISNGSFFCVKGQTPQPQYNYIRVTTPERGQYQYRLMPVPGVRARQLLLNRQVWQLQPGTRRSYTASGCTVAFSGRLLTLTANETTNPDWIIGAVGSDYLFNNQHPFDAISDVTLYDAERNSCADNPEHEVVYINEQLEQATPQYTNLALAGLRINNSKEWNNFSSLSAYVKKGVQVEKLVATGRDSTNLLPEIAYALLTDPTIGAGQLIGASAVNRARMVTAARFCAANGFLWDGVLTDRQNLRQWIYEQAGYCILDFTIIGGQFSLMPSVPYGSDFKIAPTQAPEIKALFTDGNIRDLKVSFLSPEERQLFRATVLWRQDTDNGFPQTRVVTVRLSDGQGGSSADPEETFDLTNFCTSQDHAYTFARYALKTRKEVDHGLKFQTTPQAAMALGPGDYFRLVSQVTHTSRFRNGSIDSEGNVVSAEQLSGNYTVLYWTPGTTSVQEATLNVSGGKATTTTLWGTVFTIKNTTTVNRVYKVESLSYAEDGLVEVAASFCPLTSSGGLAVLDWNPVHFVAEFA